MNWFALSLITMLCWGCADLFYKKGTDENDRYSHLEIAVWVGLVMGVCALALIPFMETTLSVPAFAVAAVKYAPASVAYIVSMIIGYAGIRYLEASIISPVQNASGAMSVIVMAIYFAAVGRITDFGEEFSTLDVIGTVVVVAGVIALAIVEKRMEGEPKDRLAAISIPALIFPLMYCLFDTIGTAADGIILDEEAGLGLGEIDVLVLYGLTFMVAGIIAWIYMLVKTGHMYNPFGKDELKSKGAAALFEEGGQVFYVFAMSSKPMLAAPMIAAYCVVSVILLRIFVKEELKKSQYACVITVIIGIVILGISEGLAS